MNNLDKQYNAILQDILDNGEWAENRTGIRTKQLFCREIRHDMREGFPLLTSRRVPYKAELVELEGFIKGITSKKWYRDRKCEFWTPFCRQDLVPYANDPETKAQMEAEDDLGPIYGSQWREFKSPTEKFIHGDVFGGGAELDHHPKTIDQLKIIVDKIKKGIDDRRLIVMGWNPLALSVAALPCCHYSFTVYLSTCGGYIDLKWNQRSVDFPLGNALPKYGALLCLLAHEAKRIPRHLIASYENVHVYENQIEVAKRQLERPTLDKLPTIKLKTWNFSDIFDWTADNGYDIVDYQHSGVLKYPRMAV